MNPDSPVPMSMNTDPSGSASPAYFQWPQRSFGSYEPASTSPIFDVSQTPVHISTTFDGSLLDNQLPSPDQSLDLSAQLFPTAQPIYENLYDPSDLNAVIAAQDVYSAPLFDPLYFQKKNDFDAMPDALPATSSPSTHVAIRPPPIMVPPAAPAPSMMSIAPAPAPAPVAPAQPAASTASSDAKRKRHPPNQDVVAMRKRKHNEVEVRRRQNMNEQFDELQRLTRYDRKEKDKDSILRTVIDKLMAFQTKQHMLEAHLAAKRSGAVVPSDLSKVEATAASSLVTSIYQQLAPNQKLHNVAFTNSTVAMAVGSLSGNLLDANERMQELLGFSVAELRTMSCITLTHPDDLSAIFKKFKTLVDGTVPCFSIDKRMLNRYGQYVPMQTTTWLIKENGKGKYFFCFCVPKADLLTLPAQVTAME